MNITEAERIEKLKLLLIEEDSEHAEGLGSAITEMFEVLEVHRGRVDLVNFYNGMDFPGVRLPPDVMELVRPQDVFLMTIIPDAYGWRSLWVSPPYETFEFDEDAEIQ